MMTAFAKGSTKRLNIIQAYKRLVTPLVGAELFTSSATEIREALTPGSSARRIHPSLKFQVCWDQILLECSVQGLLR